MVNQLEVASDLWRCPDGQPHKWEYRGKAAQKYLCFKCLGTVTKAALKEGTDNA